MNRVVHFEINADDPDRAAAIYAGIFGWKIEKRPGIEPEYRMVMTAETDCKEQGIDGGLILRNNGTARSPQSGANAFVCTVQVDKIDAVSEKVLSAGGRVAVPNYSIGTMSWQECFIDTAGDLFGSHQTVEH
jgi:predicted enzyme related to lactoylglutathione lyase